MIWFSCNQCGKVHGRPETVIGATIFCDCGLGVVVPWESTVAEPPTLPAVPDLPPVLKLEPVTFNPSAGKASPPSVQGRKRGRLTRRDPNFCFNHENVARQTSCADCGEGFCSDCLVLFEGGSLCGPCKNYRVKNLQRSLPPSNMSILSMLIALLTPPVALILLQGGQRGFPWGSLLALLPLGLAAALAIQALRETNKDPKIAGRSLAITALVSVGVTTFLIFLMAMYSPHLWT